MSAPGEPMTVEYSADRGNGNTIRQELWRIEDRLLREIEATKQEVVEWHDRHSVEHRDLVNARELRRQDTERRFDTLSEAMTSASIRNAKLDGALGVFRFIFDTLGRNWPVLVAGLAAALAFAGSVHITVQ